jgi:glycosyltransferase involved in cell wall biosynthesis
MHYHQMKNKNILVLAYAISPTRGSEYSVAWNYVTRMSKYNNLTVIYGISGKHMGDCEEMENYASKNQNQNIHFICIKPNRWTNLLNWCNRHNFFTYSFYFAYNLWQKQVYKFAKEIVEQETIDLIHFLNPIGYREPGYLWKIDKPYMWGPIGGVSNYPKQLAASMSWKSLLKYQLRTTINNFQFKYNQRLKKALINTDLLLTATSENQKRFKTDLKKDSLYLPENGITAPLNLNLNKFQNPNPIELVFIGSIDGRKNLHLLLDALYHIKNKSNIHLNIVGDGPERSILEKYAERKQISKILTWYGNIKRNEVYNIIQKSHLHIITSINEGNPTTIWEAMSQGVPTLTLNHCGMHDTICNKCGFKIPIISYKQVVNDIANQIQDCISNPNILIKKAQGTMECAQKYTWDKREQFLLKCYDQAIKNHIKYK